MSNNKITMTVDVLGKIDSFQSNIEKMKKELKTLDLSVESKASFDLMFKEFGQRVKQFRELTANNQINLVDEKEVIRVFNRITTLYDQLTKKSTTGGILKAGFEQDKKTLESLINIYTQYDKELNGIQNKVKRATQSVNEQTAALEEQKKKYKALFSSAKEYKQLLNNTYAASAKEKLDEYLGQSSVENKLKQWQKILEQKQTLHQFEGQSLKDLIYSPDSDFWKSKEFKKSDMPYIEWIQDFVRQYQEAVDIQEKFNNADFNKLEEKLSNEKNTLEDLTRTYERLAKERDKAVAKAVQGLQDIDWSRYGLKQEEINSYEKLGHAIEVIKNKGDELSQDTLKSIKQALEAAGVEVEGLTGELEKAHTSFNLFEENKKQVESFAKRLLQFFSIDNAVQLFKRSLREAFQAVKELDTVMTEMAVVTELDVGDYWKQLPKYTAQANALGVATKSVYEAATLYYQQGLKTQQVEQVTTATLKLARIASLDAAEATDRMTNALRGFNMEINETNADRIADVYSKLAAITASNVDEISTAMTKTASIASNAGMEFETTAAFLSQIIETTRESAETAGTALKTVIARFQELKKSPTEIGEVDGEIVDANKVEGALRSVGIALRDSEGQFRKLDEVFLELASKWDSLDKNTQRYIATIAAGSRQQSRFIAMMSNYEHTMELVDAANNAAGASQEQYEKTLESLKSKLDKLRNAWNEFVMGLANSDLIKGAVDLLTWLLNVINKLTNGWDGLSKGVLRLGAAIIMLKGGKVILAEIIRLLGIETTALAGASAARATDTVGLFAHTKALLANTLGFKAHKTAVTEDSMAMLLFGNTITPTLILLGELLVLLAAFVYTIHFLHKNTPAGRLKTINSELEELENNATESRTAVDNLSTSLASLGDQYTALDKLTVGTLEWRKAVNEINSSVLELISNYPELAQYAKFNDGVWRLETDPKVLKKVFKTYRDKALQDQQDVLLKQVEKAKMEQIDTSDDYLNSLNHSSARSRENKIIESYATEFLRYGKSFQELSEEAHAEAKKTTDADLSLFYDDLAARFEKAVKDADYNKELTDELLKYNELIEKTADELSGIKDNIASTILELSGVISPDDDNYNAEFTQLYKILANGDWYNQIYESNGKDREKANAVAIDKLQTLAQALKDPKVLADGWLKNIFTGVGLTAENLDQLSAIEDFNSVLPQAFKDLYNIYEHGDEELKLIIEQARNTAIKQHSKADEIFSNFGLTDVLTNFTSEARIGLANHLQQVAIELGSTATTEFGNLLLTITQGLTDDTQKEFISILNGIDWTQDDAVDKLKEQLQQVGIRIDNTDGQFDNFISRFTELNKALQTITVDKFKTQVENLRTTFESIQDKIDNDKSTFTREEMEKVIAQGADSSQFVQLRNDEFVYLGNLEDLLKQIYNKIPTVTQQYLGGLQNDIDIGNRINTLLNTGGDKDNWNQQRFIDWSAGNLNLTEGMKNAIVKGAQELGLVAPDLEPGQLSAEKWDELLSQRFAEVYGPGGMAWINNQATYEAEQQHAYEAPYAMLSSGQEILNASAVSNDEIEGRSRVLQGLIQKTEGLSEAVKVVNKELAAENKGWKLNQDLIRAHVYDVNKNTEQVKEFINDLKDYTNVLNKDTEEYSTDEKTQLSIIAERGQKVFGPSFDYDAVIKYRKELAEIASEGENAETAWRNMVNGLEQDFLKANFGDKFEEIQSLVNELNLDGTVRLDTQQAYQQLLAILGSAEAVEKALQFRATISYNGTSVGFQVNGNKYDTLKEARAAAKAAGLKMTDIETYEKSGAAVATEKDWEEIIKELMNSGKGGSKTADKTWENPYDWLYTLTEQIVEKTRERNKLEREYTRLLNKNAETVYASSKYYDDQLANLDKQKELQEQMFKERHDKMLELKEQNADLNKYIEWDDTGKYLNMKWSVVDTITDPELGERLEKYVSKLEFIQDEMDKADDALWDIDSAVQDIKDKAIDNYLNFEHRLSEAIQQTRQDELDAEKATQDAINQAREDLVDSIQKNIDKFRKDREREKSQKEISDLETRIAYLRQDTSNANKTTILELEKQLSDLKENFTDTLVDDALTTMQEQNQAAADQRERQLQYQQDLIDWQAKTGYFAEQAYQLIEQASKNGHIVTEDEEIMQYLRAGEHWESLSHAEQIQKFFEAQESLVNATLAIQKQLILNANTNYSKVWLEAYKEYLTAQQKGDVAGMQAAKQKMYNAEMMRDAKIEMTGDTEHQKTDGDWTNTATGNDVNALNDVQQQVFRENFDSATDYSAKWADAYAEFLAAKTNNNVAQQQEAILKMQGYESARDMKITSDPKLAAKYPTTNGQATEKAIKGDLSAAYWMKNAPKYATGGLVPFTGPAWLDGTSAHPEIVLNARDSENLIQLRDILRSESGVTHSGDNYYDINISVDQLSSDYDVDQVAERIKQIIYNDAMYRNVNAVGIVR